MTHLLRLMVLIFLAIGCNTPHESQDNRFVLTGMTNGLSDGTMIYLFDNLRERVIDSTEIRNNAFEISGQLIDSPSSVTVRTADWSEYRYLWMENTKMTFDASTSGFFTAAFTGSKVHEWAHEQLFSLADTIGGSEPTEADFNKVRSLYLDFVKKHPSSIVSANILSIYAGDPEISLEQIKSLYEALSDELKQNTYGQRIKRTIATYEKVDPAKASPEVGDDFADFEMLNTDGRPIKLSDHLGKITLLEFWASWCGPCIQEMPSLKATYDTYNPEGFKIFAVSLDNSEEKWKKAISDLNLNWTHVSDLIGFSNIASMQYGITAIPHNLLIDADGKIVGRNLRGNELDEKLSELLD